MKNLAIFLLLSLAFIPACKDDPAAPAPDNSAKILPLTSREAVLNNLEVGWNKRSPEAIDELLDPNFTFFLSPGDVGGGLPVQWDRATELSATTTLFLSNKQTMTPPSPVCLSVHVDINADDVEWDEVIPDQFPDETWYSTTLAYSFRFEFENDQIYQNKGNATAQFTVRNMPQGGKDHWRLVEFRDLADFLATGSRQTASSSKTWGGIKALYR